MRGEKRARKSASNGQINNEQWCNEIIGDVFELWIGISRLMARVQTPQPKRDLRSQAAGQRPIGKQTTTRRAPRRKPANDRTAA